jgi:hypothetical protein
VRVWFDRINAVPTPQTDHFLSAEQLRCSSGFHNLFCDPRRGFANRSRDCYLAYVFKWGDQMRSHLSVFSLAPRSWAIGAILSLAAAGVFSACGTQSNSSASPTATGSSATGSSGCEINPEPICEQIAKQPVVESNTGLTVDAREREGNSARTSWEHTSMQTPGGTSIAINCGINAEHSSVVSAQALKGAPLTDADVMYLRSQGLCKN